MRGVVAVTLCALLAGEPLAGQGGRGHRGPTSAGHSAQSDVRVLHVLNRFTFGPTPGEVAAVKEIGVEAWFEQQLNPAQIDDSALEARLASFPAMRLSQADLMARYPSEQTIRQMMQRNSPLPTDSMEHAIYADQMALLKARQDRDQEKAAASGTGGTANQSGTAPSGPGGTGSAGGGDTVPATAKPDPDAPIAAAHVETLYRDLDAVKILNLPPEQRMQRLVAMSGPMFVAFRVSLSGAELAQLIDGLTPEQREQVASMQNAARMVGAEVTQERLVRDIYSERQLEAVMTDFWLNHFNVYIRKNAEEPYLLPAFERDVIRPNALGKFEDLLVATAKSPAMLEYLDNEQSVGPDSKAAVAGANRPGGTDNTKARAAAKDRGLNENYGRELMELHTLGVNGGYTQKDVTEVAKVFTGWTVTPAQRGAEFQFDERRHEPGPKTVLGQTIPEGGMGEGLAVLHLLAMNPATARFISRRLAVRFVSDDPPAGLVDRMAKSWLDSGGDIRTVLRTMFQSPEFWAPEVNKAKIKTPEEFVISAARVSGAQVNNAGGLVSALDRLGMPLFGMQTPNGYSWKSEDWVSAGALVSRMNFAVALAAGKVQGATVDWTKLLAAAPTPRTTNGKAGKSQDPETAVREAKLERLVLAEPATDRTRAAVLTQAVDPTPLLQGAREFQGAAGRNAMGTPNGGTTPLPTAGSAEPRPGVQHGGTLEDKQAAVMAGLLMGSPEFQRR